MSNDERLLGRLEEFKEVSERRFDNLEYGVHTLGKKIDALNEFKWRMTGGALVLGIIVSAVIKLATEWWAIHGG